MSTIYQCDIEGCNNLDIVHDIYDIDQDSTAMFTDIASFNTTNPYHICEHCKHDIETDYPNLLIENSYYELSINRLIYKVIKSKSNNKQKPEWH